MRTVNYDELLNDLNRSETKYEVYQALMKQGIRTSTNPTQTRNKNDLYFQLADKSRIQIEAESIKLLTNEAVSRNHAFEMFSFKDVTNEWDGRNRTKFTTVRKTTENLKIIMDYFLEDERNVI